MKIISSQKSEIEFRKRTVKGVRFYVSDITLSVITDHADAGLDEGIEIMGLLIGRFYKDDEGQYAVVSNIATSGLIADPMSVRFDKESMDELFDKLVLKDGECIVGWYHSHLNIGCFMSPTDVETQDGIFGGECGFAIVIDPVRKEMKVFDSTLKDPQPVDMIVMQG